MPNKLPEKFQATFNAILVPVTISFGLGIVWCRFFERHDYLFLTGALITALGSLWSYTLQRYQLSRLLLLPFFLLIGVVHATPYCRPPQAPEHIYNRINAKQMATITGSLQRAPTIINAEDETRTRLLVNVTSLHRPSGNFPDRNTTVDHTFGLVQLTIKGRPPPNLEPGDLLMAKTLLSQVRSSSTPGSFDYQKFMANQAIWITGWVKSPVWVCKIHELPDAISHHSLKQLRFLPEKIRYRLALFLDNTLNKKTASLYKAILIGDKTDVPPGILEDFKAIGCMHILAISGMHMGLLAFVLYSSCIWLLKRSTRLILYIPIRKTAIVVSLVPLAVYALIAGCNTPVIRALIMTGVFSMAVVFNRNKSIINSVALTALIILIWEPTSLFTVSFQLSFAAVIAIAILYPALMSLFSSAKNGTGPLEKIDNTNSRKIINWLKAAILISITALVGTAPLLVHHFNRISLISPITNILVEPLICLWSLTIGLMACIVIPFSINVAAHLFHIGGWGLETSVWLASLFAKLPFSSLWLSTPSTFEIIIYYILLSGLIYTFLYAPKRTNLLMTFLCACMVLLVSIPVVSKIFKKMGTQTTVTVLDVAHGSSIHIMLPEGKNILIDGGGPASTRFNVGERLIAPYLWKNRIHRIDEVIISHPHADHYNGLYFIFKRFKPSTLWINGQPEHIPGYDRLLELARQLGTTINICRPGTVVCQSGDAAIICIANPLQENISSGTTVPCT
jgi:competence protein ComEC